MASEPETKKTSGLSNKAVVAAAVVVALAAILIAYALLSRGGGDASPKIGYAADATVMMDQESLQAAMDEAMRNAQGNAIALQYKNNAYSMDGVNFECYIANSTSNLYDMYINIYADAEMTDQLYLSGLVPPGSGFEFLNLERTLDTGDHTVYVAVTQVDTGEDGTQVIKNQVVHTMDFHVVPVEDIQTD